MNFRSILLIFVLTFLVICPYLFYFFLSEENNLNSSVKDSEYSEYLTEEFYFELGKEKKLEVGSEFYIKSFKMIDGYKFYINLESDKRIIAHLTNATKDEANSFLLNLFKNSSIQKPSVVLRRKSGEHWIVDFYFLTNENKINLIEELRSKDLLL
jgi:hypothetical protein